MFKKMALASLVVALPLTLSAQSSDKRYPTPKGEAPKAAAQQPAQKTAQQPAQTAAAQTAPQLPKMTFMGIFDSGQPESGIYKLFDPTDRVLCYVLMPNNTARRNLEGRLIFEGNSLGSISCVKVP